MFCPWSCEEERGSYLFCKDILDVPFQLLSSKYQSNCRRPLTMQIAKKQARTTSKYAIAKYTQVFCTSDLSNITASQRTKTIFFFFNCTCTCLSSAILLAIVARQSLSLFFKQNITGQTEFVLSNIREVPASTSKSRKIRIVARRRFWRFLLVH